MAFIRRPKKSDRKPTVSRSGTHQVPGTSVWADTVDASPSGSSDCSSSSSGYSSSDSGSSSCDGGGGGF